MALPPEGPILTNVKEQTGRSLLSQAGRAPSGGSQVTKSIDHRAGGQQVLSMVVSAVFSALVMLRLHTYFTRTHMRA